MATEGEGMKFLAHVKTSWPLAIVVAGIAGLSMVACGSDSSVVDAPVTAPEEEVDVIVIVRVSDTFGVDSFVNAGWKKSKEFSTETVPESNEIWYGFYKSQDVEIRFYSSHADALGVGVESASAAVGRVSNANIQGNAIFASGQRKQYNDFMVAGNVVILCQQDIAICAEMVENIP